MKRLLLSLSLLAAATPLIAGDEGGDGAQIPSYAELVREGYGPRPQAADPYGYGVQGYAGRGYGPERTGEEYGIQDYSPGYGGRNVLGALKPTHAYYWKDPNHILHTIYYDYTVVPVRDNGEIKLVYAFGYPSEFYLHHLPDSIDDTNLDKYRLELQSADSEYAPGKFEAHAVASHGSAVTTVRSTAAAATASPQPATTAKAAP